MCLWQSAALGGCPAGPSSIHLWGSRKENRVIGGGGGARAEEGVVIRASAKGSGVGGYAGTATTFLSPEVNDFLSWASVS